MIGRITFGAATDRKPRELDPYLRALIDEAVAQGRVTVVAQGVSGIPYERWDAGLKRFVSSDTRPATVRAKETREKFEAARAKQNEAAAAAARVRRIEIAGLVEAGLHWRDIAKLRGEGEAAVRLIVNAIKRGEIDARTGERIGPG